MPTSATVESWHGTELTSSLRAAAKLALTEDRVLILTHNEIHYFVSPKEITQFLMTRVMQPAYPNQDRKETT